MCSVLMVRHSGGQHTSAVFVVAHPSAMATELELLLNGKPEIDIEDLQRNIVYQGGCTEQDFVRFQPPIMHSVGWIVMLTMVGWDR